MYVLDGLKLLHRSCICLPPLWLVTPLANLNLPYICDKCTICLEMQAPLVFVYASPFNRSAAQSAILARQTSDYSCGSPRVSAMPSMPAAFMLDTPAFCYITTTTSYI